MAGFYATEEWIQNNPEAIARLKRAIDKASQLIKDNPAEAQDILQKQMKLDPALVAGLALPKYDTHIDPAGVQAVMDAAYEVGIVKEPLKAQAAIAGAAQ